MPFPQPRQQMPGADPTSSLRSLLGLSSPANVGGLTGRGLDVVTGMDTFEPSDQELQDEQMRRISVDPTIVPSRESLRTDAMQKIRSVLGMADIKHRQQMETEAQKAQIAASQWSRQQGAVDHRAQAQRDAQMAMLEQRLNATDASREDSQAHAAKMQAERLAQQHGSPAAEIPAQMTSELGKARDTYNGGWNSFVRQLPGGFGGGRQAYEANLVNVLTRMGSMQELGPAAAQAKQQGMSVADFEATTGATLHPYEREYLQLVLGR